MSRRTWHRPRYGTHEGRDVTRARVIETISRTAPETKGQLADAVGISTEYLSELLQELKRDGVVSKAYVVDESAVYAKADVTSRLYGGHSTDEDPGTPDRTSGRAPTGPGGSHRGTDVLALLARLEDVTSTQYEAARLSFVGEEPDRPASALESLTNERYSAVLSELKSYTLTTDWPGNRVASDLATVATNLEIVGDRACFIADVVEGHDVAASGVVEERVGDVFDAGERINDDLRAILLECDLTAYEDLVSREESVHRDLDELLELITAYDPEMYGFLATVTRALERAIFYWVHSAEIAVGLHSGVQPDHPRI